MLTVPRPGRAPDRVLGLSTRVLIAARVPDDRMTGRLRTPTANTAGHLHVLLVAADPKNILVAGPLVAGPAAAAPKQAGPLARPGPRHHTLSTRYSTLGNMRACVSHTR